MLNHGAGCGRREHRLLHYRARLGLWLQTVSEHETATNTTMYQRMAEDMDINCGVVLDDGVSIQEMGGRIFDRLLEARLAARQRVKRKVSAMMNSFLANRRGDVVYFFALAAVYALLSHVTKFG